MCANVSMVASHDAGYRTNTVEVTMVRIALVSVLGAVACAPDEGPPVTGVDDGGTEEPAGPTVATLLLPTRDGTSPTGWSIDARREVPEEEADLVLASWDCGARGRWVELRAPDGQVCAAEACGTSVQIGGSDPAVAVGEVFVVEVGDTRHEVQLIDRTDTPFDWYEAEDLSFEVVLSID